MSLRLANRLSGTQQFGFFFLLFSTPFVWLFVGQADFSFLTFLRGVDRAVGVIERVEKTGASENKSRIYAHHYSFYAAGTRYEGTSYASGSPGSANDEVEVEFKKDDPGVSRIAGMRRAPFGPGVVFVLIFPAVALALIIIPLILSRKRNELLEHGVAVMARLKSKEATSMSVNRQTVYKLTFEYVGEDGRSHTFDVKTHMTMKLEDEAEELVLYDPKHPERALPIDEIPGPLLIGEGGELMAVPLSRLKWFLVLPALVVAANALAIVLKFLY